MIFIPRLSTKDNAVSGWCDFKYFIQSVPIQKIKCKTNLTILARYEAKIAKICNFWTFRPVIQLNNVTALFTSMEHWAKKLFVAFKKKKDLLAESQTKLQIYAIFASYLASILNPIPADHLKQCLSEASMPCSVSPHTLF